MNGPKCFSVSCRPPRAKESDSKRHVTMTGYLCTCAHVRTRACSHTHTHHFHKKGVSFGDLSIGILLSIRAPGIDIYSTSPHPSSPFASTSPVLSFSNNCSSLPPIWWAPLIYPKIGLLPPIIISLSLINNWTIGLIYVDNCCSSQVLNYLFEGRWEFVKSIILNVTFGW